MFKKVEKHIISVIFAWFSNIILTSSKNWSKKSNLFFIYQANIPLKINASYQILKLINESQIKWYCQKNNYPIKNILKYYTCLSANARWHIVMSSFYLHPDLLGVSGKNYTASNATKYYFVISHKHGKLHLHVYANTGAPIYTHTCTHHLTCTLS